MWHRAAPFEQEVESSVSWGDHLCICPSLTSCLRRPLALFWDDKFLLLWLRDKNHMPFALCCFPNNRIFWCEWWSFDHLLWWLCLVPILTNHTLLQGQQSWSKDKSSGPQAPRLWLWACKQYSASWVQTGQACMIQLRRERESCFLPGIHLSLECSWTAAARRSSKPPFKTDLESVSPSFV